MNIIKTGDWFTNTTVPRFNGDSCWQQHLQIFRAIVKSNGWTDETAALQLFLHLDGEALYVALLMPEGERAEWKGLSHKAFRIITIRQEGWRCSGSSLRARLAKLEWILPRLLHNWRSWQSEDSGTWASAPETGWSGTRSLQPNGVVGLRRHLNSVPPDTQQCSSGYSYLGHSFGLLEFNISLSQ